VSSAFFLFFEKKNVFFSKKQKEKTMNTGWNQATQRSDSSSLQSSSSLHSDSYQLASNRRANDRFNRFLASSKKSKYEAHK
jgi:hypothetical protein